MSKKIFLIAGEPSGDSLGGGLMKSLKAQSPEPVEFSGVGGERMEEEGLESLLPMEELCIMGIGEVISQLPRILRLINGVVEEIEKAQPDVVITIDLPDFNFRVAQRLKKRGNFKGKIIHYVAPSVWAWRPKRAQKIAKFLDGLICLFPFEPPYFDKYELPARYIGHPIIEKELEQADGPIFRKRYDIDEDAQVLGLFFGSREEELKKHKQVLNETVDILLEQHPDLVVIVPTLPSLEFEVRNLLEDVATSPLIITNQEFKYNAFAACDIAIAVSGTVGLELAYIGVPHVITYKTSALTYMIAKSLIKIKHIHLANILLARTAVPEFIQGKSNSLEISKTLLTLLKSEEAKAEQARNFSELRHLMRSHTGQKPSDKAVSFIFEILNGNYKPEELPPMPEPVKEEPKPKVKEKPKDAAKTPSGETEEGGATEEGTVEGVNLPELINKYKAKFAELKEHYKKK